MWDWFVAFVVAASLMGLTLWTVWVVLPLIAR